MTDAQCKAVNADGLRCVRDIAHEGQHAVPGNLWDTPLDSEPPSDEEVIRAALRRLNPEFHKSDSAWPALDRLTARLTEADELRKALTEARLYVYGISLRKDWANWRQAEEVLARVDAALARAALDAAEPGKDSQ